CSRSSTSTPRGCPARCSAMRSSGCRPAHARTTSRGAAGDPGSFIAARPETRDGTPARSAAVAVARLWIALLRGLVFRLALRLVFRRALRLVLRRLAAAREARRGRDHVRLALPVRDPLSLRALLLRVLARSGRLRALLRRLCALQ